MIKKLQWSGDPYEELTRIKSGLRVEYVCIYANLLTKTLVIMRAIYNSDIFCVSF